MDVKRLLVTGGCGFLGSNLARAAIDRGIETWVFDNLSRDGSAANLAWLGPRSRFTFRHGDIRNPNDVERVVRESAPDAVFHLAGQVAMTTSIADPRRDFETNALGSLNVLDAVRAHAESAAVVYSSTNKVYGDLEQFRYAEEETRYSCLDRPRGFDEATPLDFQSPYGCSKGAADQYLLDHARVFGTRSIVFRHSSMYGGRQFATADQGWIGWFCTMAAAQESGDARPFTISGSGKQVRDVLHADDMVRLYFAAVEQAEKVSGQAFNIGGGMANSLSLLELFELLSERIGTPLRFERLPARTSDQRVFVADVAKAERQLAWSPLVGAREGVSAMLDWVREHAPRPFRA